MTIRHLRIFVAVYRAENVTHAAEELHLTQPAVTRAVQELEQYYGTRLFGRMYRHLSPTEALLQAAARGLGVAVLPEARARAAVARGQVCLRPIAEPGLVRRHVAAWHKEKYLTASMQRFLALCRDPSR